MSDDNINGREHAHPLDDNHQRHSRSARSTMTGRLLLLVTVLVVVGLIGVVLGRSGVRSLATVSVTGSGTVQGTPDTVNFQIGVHTVSATASAALNQNTAKEYALEAALHRHGVTNNEMQTSNLTIYENTNNMGGVTGFSVDDTLNITMHNTKRAGAAIDAAAHVVGNGIVLNGVSFSITNQSTLLASARARAMKNARLAADELASAGKTHVLRMLRAVEQENQGSNPYYPFAVSDAQFKTTVPIQAGSQPITVQVTVVYSLAN